MTEQSGAAAAAIVGAPVPEKTAVGGHGVEATVEEQGEAIISMAKRAVEEEAAKVRIGGDGGAAAGEPSLKRSLECFLEGRKNKAAAAAAAASRRCCRLESSSTTSSSSSSN